MLTALLSFACTEKKEVAVQLYSVRNVIGTNEKYAENHETVLKGQIGRAHV